MGLNGIWMTGNTGQNVVISGSALNPLTLSGGTINGTGGLGILVDNTNAFALTVSAPIKLSGAQTWRNNSANLLTIGDVNVAKALTIDGTGNTSITGVVSGSSGVTKNGTGTLFLSGANNFTGGLTLNAGAVNIQNASALGPAGSSIAVPGGAALQLQGAVTFNPYALSLIGSGIGGTGALRNISGNNTFTGAITFGSSVTIGSDAGTMTLSGNISPG